jgi:hypothetical protein
MQIKPTNCMMELLHPKNTPSGGKQQPHPCRHMFECIKTQYLQYFILQRVVSTSADEKIKEMSIILNKINETLLLKLKVLREVLTRYLCGRK